MLLSRFVPDAPTQRTEMDVNGRISGTAFRIESPTHQPSTLLAGIKQRYFLCSFVNHRVVNRRLGVNRLTVDRDGFASDCIIQQAVVVKRGVSGRLSRDVFPVSETPLGPVCSKRI